MSEIIHPPQSRPANRIAKGLALIFSAATISTALADPVQSIFDWDLAEDAAKPVATSTSPDSAIFRKILQDPQIDAESFWDRDQRWTKKLKGKDDLGPTLSLQRSGSTQSNTRFVGSISVPQISFALTPLLLGGGLLLLQKRADSGRNYSTQRLFR